MTTRARLGLATTAFALALGLAAPACAAPTTPTRVVRDTVVTTGLAAPWGLAFLPDGSALITERDTARVLRVPADGGQARPVGRVRGVQPGGEGGLLGIAVPPGDDPRFVYVYATTARDNRVLRIAWTGDRLGRQRAILRGIPRNFFHNGGRLLATADSLFVSTGDAGDRDSAQDPASLAGKILRIRPDGRPAPGNPFPDSPVYSLGHRNVQGLALDRKGRLWATEFGEKDVDELNLIEPGGNYGWPLFEGPADTAGYVDPAAIWSPTSTASPSGLAIRGRTAYVATLRGRTLFRVPLRGTRALKPRPVSLGPLGRLRAVAVAPDRSLWLVTNNTDGRGSPGEDDDRIIRLRFR